MVNVMMCDLIMVMLDVIVGEVMMLIFEYCCWYFLVMDDKRGEFVGVILVGDLMWWLFEEYCVEVD